MTKSLKCKVEMIITSGKIKVLDCNLGLNYLTSGAGSTCLPGAKGVLEVQTSLDQIDRFGSLPKAGECNKISLSLPL